MSWLALSGCGSKTSPEQQVRQAWSHLRAAVIAEDWPTVCAGVSANAQKVIIDSTRSRTCVDALKRAAAVAPQEIDKQRRAKLLHVTVMGDQATTVASDDPTPKKWTRVNGRWLGTD